MRIVLGCLLLAVTGCYGPSFKDCEVSCAGGTCPSGLSCVDSVCRAEGATGACGQGPEDAPGDTMDADPLTDMDLDGVANSVDNCPAKANPDQGDEDGDLKGDVCDPCPVPVLGGQGGAPDDDPDGDGVGNGCDPNPNTPGDKIFAFTSFKVRPPGVNVTGNWTFDGKATVTASPGELAAMLWAAPVDPNGQELHMVVVAPVTPLTLPPDSQVGAIDQYSVNAGGIACTIGFTPFGTGELAVTRFDPAGGRNRLSSMPVPVAVNTADMIGYARLSGVTTCVDQQAQLQAPQGNLPPADPNVGLGSIGMQAAFDFVMIISSP